MDECMKNILHIMHILNDIKITSDFIAVPDKVWNNNNDACTCWFPRKSILESDISIWKGSSKLDCKWKNHNEIVIKKLFGVVTTEITKLSYTLNEMKIWDETEKQKTYSMYLLS